MANYPRTFGEWDQEIDRQSTEDLLRWRQALRELEKWEAFRLAFKEFRIFVLGQSIDHMLEKRKEGDGKTITVTLTLQEAHATMRALATANGARETDPADRGPNTWVANRIYSLLPKEHQPTALEDRDA